MIVWGGADESDFYVYSTNTGGRYDPAADTGAPTTTTNAPEERNLHTAVWIGTAMIVRGGELNTGDVILAARDPQVAWYGASAAVPSPDSDQDGFPVCAGDCDDGNGAVRGTPAEVTGLEVQGPDLALLTWNAPAGGGAVRYDTLRSAAPDDFLAGATCVESDDPSDASASDADPPAIGGIFFYLIRAENSCPCALGTGPLGFTSSGVPLQGRACP